MKTSMQKSEQFDIEKFFDELFTLESLLKLSKKSYLFESLQGKSNIADEDINNSINIINIALEKINNLKELNYLLEKENIYKSTPTIAADK